MYASVSNCVISPFALMYRIFPKTGLPDQVRSWSPPMDHAQPAKPFGSRPSSSYVSFRLMAVSKASSCVSVHSRIFFFAQYIRTAPGFERDSLGRNLTEMQIGREIRLPVESGIVSRFQVDRQFFWMKRLSILSAARSPGRGHSVFPEGFPASTKFIQRAQSFCGRRIEGGTGSRKSDSRSWIFGRNV